ncbi:hypothetical protein F4678DRAFT_436568 [Xylaria arbuscula]|nr:hypothetical protein F4678DRAFT_436568 [Xylaria arbuscula]
MALPLFFLLVAASASGYVPSQRIRDNGFSLPTLARGLTEVSHISPSGEDLKRCRCIPGDSCWPSPADWDLLNNTVHGRLISTVPVAQICHLPNYDEASCNALKTSWVTPEPHIFAPGDFVAPYFQNQTCDPYTSENKTCTLGNYPPYSINMTGAEDAIAGLKFAKKHNIRVVIKSTGQDFLGKSSGKGGLELWVANLKSSSFIPDYESNDYKGPALKVGAGFRNSEAAELARKLNVRLVGGSSPTVGVVGGFTSGGGHSPLTGHYGLGADNVLEWEIVTPAGQHVIAKPTGKYADLYWALSGGGGGTWGVILSMTSRVYPDGPVGGAQLTVSAEGLTEDAYWGAVTAFHSFIPTFASDGTVATNLLKNDVFTIYAVTSPDKTADQVKAQLSTYVKYLDTNNIPYTVNYTSFDNYYDHLKHFLGPYPYGTFPITQLTGGRLVPRAVLESQNSTKNLVDTVRSVLANGHFYITLETFDVNATATARAIYHEGKNAVQPAFRNSNLYYIVIGEWDFTLPRAEMVSRQYELTNSVMPALKAATPGSGSYLNEADFGDPDWQQDFYGENYPRLSQIKSQYDPDSVLYARTAVGSDKLQQDGEGRLCFNS